MTLRTIIIPASVQPNARALCKGLAGVAGFALVEVAGLAFLTGFLGFLGWKADNAMIIATDVNRINIFFMMIIF